MSIRLAAGIAAAALLCACAGSRSGSTSGGPASPSSAPIATSSVSGPQNAPIPLAGRAGAISLDGVQRRTLDEIVAKAPASLRPRLRYALATADTGTRRLVVYDGEGLGAGGRHGGRPHEYIVFRVLNSGSGEHYDPQQNSVVAPIPPAPQRESPVTAPSP